MTRKSAILLLTLLLIAASAACGASLRDSRIDAPPTLQGTITQPTAEATAAPVTEDAAGYARAFYRAWETGDYLGMYSLLAPSQPGAGR